MRDLVSHSDLFPMFKAKQVGSTLEIRSAREQNRYLLIAECEKMI